MQEAASAFPKNLRREMEDYPAPVWKVYDFTIQHFAIDVSDRRANGISPVVNTKTICGYNFKATPSALLNG
ncbi:hypothetical protein RUE5091_02508 [Ruegeria denitrificans]|uniref:Uncharacterized protein n=1 Tax=Ruegeria denitrificans TaxID=1715692 RepID=A0A0P1IBN1_9RHOB|nr:hypothetical protein RUE5091_02508 [Ruegeria denitrificans]